MIRQYGATEAYLSANLDDLAARAVEGDSYHTAIEAATTDVGVSLATANTAVDTAVTFSKPFVAAPAVMLTLTAAGTPGAYVTVLAVNITTTGFMLRAASGAAQTISLRWLAYGRRQ